MNATLLGDTTPVDLRNLASTVKGHAASDTSGLRDRRAGAEVRARSRTQATGISSTRAASGEDACQLPTAGFTSKRETTAGWSAAIAAGLALTTASGYHGTPQVVTVSTPDMGLISNSVQP